MSSSSRRRIRCLSVDAQEASLIGRARKLRDKGETRKALIALREACLRDENAAWLWTLYGSLLAEKGRPEDARAALRHALWLRRSAGDEKRAVVTERLLDSVGYAAA
jgi:tetratricopeptide (TPR) repeat protein